MKPSVSVIIPTYNRAAFLREAIASAQQQTYAPLEILVVDDGSTDATREVVRAFGDSVKYIFQNHRGPGAARNTGVQYARGELLAFLDDDDVWLSDGLARSVARLLNPNAPQVDLVLGLLQRVRRVESSTGEIQWLPIEHPWGALTFCSTVMPRAVMERVGRLDESVPYSEDIDWFLRARELGMRIAMLEHVTALYRRHEQNLTRDRAQVNEHFLKALGKSLTRRAERGTTELNAMEELPTLESLQKMARVENES